MLTYIKSLFRPSVAKTAALTALCGLIYAALSD
jgi:hypothetical protein